MTFIEAATQFILAGGSVVLATYVGRRAPYLGALILLFPVKVIATLIFLPDGDKQVLGGRRRGHLCHRSVRGALKIERQGNKISEAGKNFVLC